MNRNKERRERIKEETDNPQWRQKVGVMKMEEDEKAIAEIDATFTPKVEGQVTLGGERPKYPIAHKETVTVTHKFSSGVAKMSVSEKALDKWQGRDDGDTTILGLVKTKIKVAPSVEGRQWEALCEEFAEVVEEEML